MNSKRITLLTILGSYIFVVIIILLTDPAEVLLKSNSTARLQLLGAIFGYLGLLLLWWQVMLGARGLVAKFIPDLIWVNSLHKRLGKYGYLQILIHPVIEILLTWEFYLQVVSGNAVPNPFVILGSVGFILISILWLSGAFLRTRISYRAWKSAHFVGYAVLPILVIHALNSGTIAQSSVMARMLLQFILSSFLLVLLYRILSQIGVLKHTHILKSSSPITPTVTRFDFIPESKVGLDPKPGQFVYLQTSRLGESHPFTVIGSEQESGMISLAIKSSGKYSSSLIDLTPGSRVWIDGPFGVFTQEISNEDYPTVIIAGGIGITPYISQIENLSKTTQELVFFYAARTKDELAFYTQLNEIVNPNFKLIVTLNDAGGTDHHQGFIDLELIEKHTLKDLNTYRYFITGPKPMMNNLTRDLTRSGVSTDQIFIEEFGL